MKVETIDFWKQTHDKAKPFVKRFRNALDIGCRTGQYTRYLVEDFRHVYCFDPRPFKTKFILNVRSNNYTKYVVALGDKNEQVKMFGGVITEEREDYSYPEKIKIVEQKKLDDYNLKNIDYMKVDVEGHELKVLKGAVQTITKYKPLIVIEQNDEVELYNKGQQNEALDFLKVLGYSVQETSGEDYILTFGSRPSALTKLLYKIIDLKK